MQVAISGILSAIGICFACVNVPFMWCAMIALCFWLWINIEGWAHNAHGTFPLCTLLGDTPWCMSQQKYLIKNLFFAHILSKLIFFAVFFRIIVMKHGKIFVITEGRWIRSVVLWPLREMFHPPNIHPNERREKKENLKSLIHFTSAWRLPLG